MNIVIKALEDIQDFGSNWHLSFALITAIGKTERQLILLRIIRNEQLKQNNCSSSSKIKGKGSFTAGNRTKVVIPFYK